MCSFEVGKIHLIFRNFGSVPILDLPFVMSIYGNNALSFFIGRSPDLCVILFYLFKVSRLNHERGANFCTSFLNLSTEYSVLLVFPEVYAQSFWICSRGKLLKRVGSIFNSDWVSCYKLWEISRCWRYRKPVVVCRKPLVLCCIITATFLYINCSGSSVYLQI